MSGGSNIYRNIINAAVFIFMEIAALNMLRDSSVGKGFFVSKLSHDFIGALWGGAQGIANYFALGKVNESLSKENFALRAMVREMDARRDSLKAAAAASGRAHAAGYSYIWAEVVKISRNKLHNYLIVNKGAKDGVKPHSGIITDQGIIGIIDTVGTNYSYAISFMNSGSPISARLGRVGAVGPLSWNGKDDATLHSISLQNKFAPGDTIFSSGISDIFPADIPLGLAGKSRIINGATYEIEVKLLQDFSRLRYITIVHNDARDEILSLEKKEERK